MLVVYLFWCGCIVCSLLLVCAVLKTLHFVKSILNEEQCRSVGEAGYFWDDELAVALAAKPPDVVHETLGVLKEILGQWWYSIAAKKITSKLCCISHFVQTVGRGCLQPQAFLSASVPPTFSSDCVPTHIVDLCY